MEHNRVSRIMKYVGFVLMVLGMGIPFLIAIRVIAPTMFLLFFSHTMSVVGMLCGMLGITGYADDIARPR
jgi:hypothetical protein